MAETTIDNHTLANLLLSSFHYSLGRKTYITGECADQLIRFWGVIPRDWQRLIHTAINTAIDTGRAGMECDIEQWRRVLALPVEDGNG